MAKGKFIFNFWQIWQHMVDYCDLWRFISQSQLCNGDQDGWKWHWPWKLGKFISDFLNIFGRIGQFIETYGGFFYHRTSTAMKIRTAGNAFKAWRASIAIEAWDNFGLLLAIYFGDLCCCNFCQLLAQSCRPGEPALQWKLRGLAQLLKLWVICNAWWDSSMEAGKTCNAMQLRNSNQNATNNWKEMGIQLECYWKQFKPIGMRS